MSHRRRRPLPRSRSSRHPRRHRQQRPLQQGRPRPNLPLTLRNGKLAAETRMTEPGFLLLEDGTLFRGRIAAATAVLPAVAEVVFTTNMTGYQAVFTDQSYRGQIVVM